MLTEINCMKKLIPLVCIILLACDQKKGSDEVLNQMDKYLSGMQAWQLLQVITKPERKLKLNKGAQSYTALIRLVMRWN